MEPQTHEFRINLEHFHPCDIDLCLTALLNSKFAGLIICVELSVVSINTCTCQFAFITCMHHLVKAICCVYQHESLALLTRFVGETFTVKLVNDSIVFR